jgi:hypothetical protein
MPIAAPPIAAAMSGPAPSPQEKALRLLLLSRLRLWPELLRLPLELLRFEVRLSERVAIDSSLSRFFVELGVSTGGGEAPFRL